LKLIVVYLNFK